MDDVTNSFLLHIVHTAMYQNDFIWLVGGIPKTSFISWPAGPQQIASDQPFLPTSLRGKQHHWNLEAMH